MKKLVFIACACLLSIAITSCTKTESKPVFAASAKVGSNAPDFTLRDTSGSLTSLSYHKGNVVLVEFWATWCPPCKAAIPELIDLQNRYHDRGFNVIGISIDSGADAAAKVAEFSSTHNINYPLLIADEATPRIYNVISIPISFLISKDGIITESFVGYSYDFHKNVSAQIEKLL